MALAQALEGVPLEWQDIIIDGTIGAIIDSLPPDITPPLNKIFEWARVTPLNKVRIVIIAQDPYPQEGVATGLAFSCHASVSATIIFSALLKSRLIGEHPPTADLTHWARQGILLLNRSLTTEIGRPGAHRNLWFDYTQGLVSRLEGSLDEPLLFLLWGNDAKTLKCGGRRLEYVHPAARDRSFVNCPHFREVAQIYPDIKWEPVATKIENVYTDGSCQPNNSSPASRAGYAAYFTDSQMLLIGNLAVDKVPASNIRAEGYAILAVLRKYNSDRRTDRLRICTDSQFWINMITRFMPRWTSDKFRTMANPDLTTVIWKGWDAIGVNILLQHVYAHKKRGTNEHTKFNDLVDRAANYARKHMQPGEKAEMHIDEFNKLCAAQK